MSAELLRLNRELRQVEQDFILSGGRNFNLSLGGIVIFKMNLLREELTV